MRLVLNSYGAPPEGHKRRLSGFGNAGPTEFINGVSQSPFFYNGVHVADEHTVAACHRLLQKDRLFLGPSSGAVIAAMETILRHKPQLLPDHGKVVGIMPDGGASYLSILYNNDWLFKHGFSQTMCPETHIFH